MNNLTRLIEKSRNMPALAPIYALEIDRQLRGMGKAAISFSAHALAESSIATARTLGIEQLITVQAKPKGGNAIYQAEMLVKEGMRSEAIAHAFMHAQGPEVNGLNLFYANHATQRPEVRLPYLNKYLEAYGLRIELEEGEKADFFYRLKSGKSFEKVDGPLVTVIMPAHNAESTIDLALNSLLNQSWHNLQIIIVDDASTDSTRQKAKAIANGDPRVKVLSNQVSVGPYVCRNLGVMHTLGKWVTVHDADDWAFPDRIEQQVKALTDNKSDTCTGGMLRMNAHGQITRPTQSKENFDGYQKLCYVSLMLQTEVFRKELGAWDSVRVNGDSELIERLKALGIKRTHIRRPLMLCLDNPTGLTNHRELYLRHEDGSMNKVRSDYNQAFKRWHLSKGCKKLSPFPEVREFEVPLAIQISQKELDKTVKAFMSNPKHVLKNANKIAITIDHAPAISLAEAHLPAELLYTAHILRANAAITAGDEADWLRHLNAYLAKFDVAPIHLDGVGTIFDRLTCKSLPPITDGPLISVIMPAWNAEKIVRKSAQSILNQTWRNLELLIVDDCSSDGTWAILQDIAKSDNRVKIFRNQINVGPYVSKNIALSHANGKWITGMDADDWSFPQRLQHQAQTLMINENIKVCVSGAIRMDPLSGRCTINGVTNNRPDGVMLSQSITGFFEKNFLIAILGSWDSSRFGADTELLMRARFVLGDAFREATLPCMFYMDSPNSLTNNPVTAFNLVHGMSPLRKAYREAWQGWQAERMTSENVYCEFPPYARRYEIPTGAIVPLIDIMECIKGYLPSPPPQRYCRK